MSFSNISKTLAGDLDNYLSNIHIILLETKSIHVMNWDCSVVNLKII